MDTLISCQTHQQKLSLFCSSHDKPLCKKCHQTSHDKCKDIRSIADVAANVRGSTAFNDAMIDAKRTNVEVDKLVKETKKNITDMRTKRVRYLDQTEQRGQQLIAHVNNLKQNSVQNINDIFESNEQTANDTIDKLIRLNRKLHYDEKNCNMSDIHLFLQMKKIEAHVYETNNTLKDLQEDNKLNRVDISFEENEDVSKIMSSMQSLGVVTISSNDENVSIGSRRRYQAQIAVPNSKAIHLQLHRKLRLEDGDYFGCAVLNSGSFVVSDPVKNLLCIYGEDEALKRRITLKSSYDVAVINEDLIVVSNPYDETITTIEINKGKVVSTFSTCLKIHHGQRNAPNTNNRQARGIAYNNGTVYFCVPREGVFSLILASTYLKKIVDDKNIDFDSHIVVAGDRISYTCAETDIVSSYDLNSKILFKFKDNHLLKYPYGITMDNKMNMYVTGWTSDNLVVISPDCSSCHQLLSQSDGLYHPTAVSYNPDTNQLTVVTSGLGKVGLYSIQ